jgi:hypothetical protein
MLNLKCRNLNTTTKIQGTSAGVLPQASSWPRVRSLLGEVSDEGTLFGICLFYDIFTLFISAMSILNTF